MSARRTALKLPVALVSGLEPVAVEGCDVCAALVAQRETARKVANMAKVKSCNDELASHPHPERGAA